jgi:hypothetical protein
MAKGAEAMTFRVDALLIKLEDVPEKRLIRVNTQGFLTVVFARSIGKC